MNLIKSEIFRAIRIIRSVRGYQESLRWKLPVLLSSCLKDFPNNNGNDGFHGNFLVFAVVFAVAFLFFFSLVPLRQFVNSLVHLVIFCLNFFH